MNRKRIVLVCMSWVKDVHIESIREKYSDDDVTMLVPKGKKKYFQSCFSSARVLEYDRFYKIGTVIKSMSFDIGVIISHPSRVSKIFYKLISVLYLSLAFSSIKKICFYEPFRNKYLGSQSIVMNVMYSIFAIIFAPLIAIFSLPFFFVSEFVPNFLFLSGKKIKSFVGYQYKYFGGHTVYLTKAVMAKKYGLFGISHEDYMGTPVSLHRSPLEIFFLSKLKYRNFVLLCFFLISSVFAFVCIDTKNYLLLFLIPVILLSSFYMRSLTIGHTEFLGWSFFLLSVVSYIYNQNLLSAIFFSMIVLSHITIAIIAFFTIMIISTYSVLLNLSQFLLTFSNLVLFGIVVLVCTLFFLFPFVRTRKKLARNTILNLHSPWKPKWNLPALVRLVTYLLFLIPNYFFSSFSVFSVLLMLPLLLLIWNTKIKWFFSEYTIELATVNIAALYVFFNPNFVSICTFLYLINLSPIILSLNFSNANFINYELRPVVSKTFRKKLRDVFKTFPKNSRVAIEDYPRNSKIHTFNHNILFSYLAVESDIEMLNGYGAEFVEPEIYLDYVQYLNPGSSKEKLFAIMKKTGTKYIISYTSEFKDLLLKYGFIEVSNIEDDIFKYGEAPEKSISIFKIPLDVCIIEPKTDLAVKPNFIEFFPKAGAKYFLKYNFFSAWHAYQDGVRLKIEDAKPGMIIRAKSDSKIVLKYKYLNYWKF